MKKYFFASLNNSLFECLDKINKNGEKFLLIFDKNKLKALLTDGEIRRFVINGNSLEKRLKYLNLKKPITINYNKINDKFFIQKIFNENDIEPLPVLKYGKYHDIILRKNLNKIFNCDVFILAGGKGERLYPITKNIPKPLIKISDKSIIHRLINNLSSFQIENYFISINYKKEMLRINLNRIFKNKYGKIKYIEENKPLGTAGSLKFIDQNNDSDHVLVHNSDIITDIDYKDLVSKHIKFKNKITVAIKNQEIKIKHGIIKKSKTSIVSEKPTISYKIISGIYVIEKKTISELIKKNEYLDMNKFIDKAYRNNKKIGFYDEQFFWLDIGTKDDLDLARSYFE